MLRQGIHYAKLATSPRLQRVRDLLSDGREHTTLNIVLGAGVCAVNSAISELRENGLLINCRCISKGCFAYQMIGEMLQ